MTAAPMALLQRVADDGPVPAEHQPRQRSWRIVAKRAVLASGAIERGIAFRRQRPARRDAGLSGAELSQPLRRGAGRPRRGVHRLRRWLGNGARPRRKRRRRRCRGRSADEGVEKQGAGPWPVFAGAVVKEARGGQQLRSVIVRDDKGVETEIACDLLAVSNGWNPTLHLTCHLGGKPVWQEALAAFVPGSKPKDLAVAGAAAGHLSLAEALAGRRAARRGGRERFGLRRIGAGHAAGRRRRLRARHAALVGAWRQGRGLRRSAERRHHQGYRACAAAKATAPPST